MTEPVRVSFGGTGRYDDGVYLPCIKLEHEGQTFTFWAELGDDFDIDPEDEAALDQWADKARAAAAALREKLDG